MPNELLLIVMLLFTFSTVLVLYKLFGKAGLYSATCIFAVLANIEVALLIHAFGLDQTLGNGLFAASFLITDILSEKYGKKAAQKSVNMGVATSIFFIVLVQSWLLYTPLDTEMGAAFHRVFSNTPRILLASLVVYAIAQRLDVWLYHKWWDLSMHWTKDRRAYLWLRNNGSTLISQLINTLLFTLFAFYGVYEASVLWDIMVASYAIFIVTSLLDTPFVYIARLITPLGERAEADDSEGKVAVK